MIHIALFVWFLFKSIRQRFIVGALHAQRQLATADRTRSGREPVGRIPTCSAHRKPPGDGLRSIFQLLHPTAAAAAAPTPTAAAAAAAATTTTTAATTSTTTSATTSSQ